MVVTRLSRPDLESVIEVDQMKLSYGRTMKPRPFRVIMGRSTKKKTVEPKCELIRRGKFMIVP